MKTATEQAQEIPAAPSKAIKGGEFLVRETSAGEIFVPEEWTEEQRMIAQTCRDFLKSEI